MAADAKQKVSKRSADGFCVRKEGLQRRRFVQTATCPNAPVYRSHTPRAINFSMTDSVLLIGLFV
jgi:hypothetical protein